MARITFAKIKRQRFDVGPAGVAVNMGGKRVARIAFDYHGRRGWFWYGDGINTLTVGPMFGGDFDAAKKHVREHFKRKATNV